MSSFVYIVVAFERRLTVIVCVYWLELRCSILHGYNFDLPAAGSCGSIVCAIRSWIQTKYEHRCQGTSASSETSCPCCSGELKKISQFSVLFEFPDKLYIYIYLFIRLCSLIWHVHITALGWGQIDWNWVVRLLMLFGFLDNLLILGLIYYVPSSLE